MVAYRAQMQNQTRENTWYWHYQSWDIQNGTLKSLSKEQELLKMNKTELVEVK